MKKFVNILCTALMVTAILAGCGNNGQQPTASCSDAVSSDEVITLTFGCQNKPDHNETMAMQAFKEELEERTNGRVQMTIYPSGQLGSEREVTEQVAMGTLDMSYTGPSFWSNALKAPELNVWELPFLMQSIDEQKANIDTLLIPSCEKWMVPQGVRPLFGFSMSVRNLLLTDKNVGSAEDIVGLKIRVPESTMSVDIWQSLGANPTTTPWGEAYTALSQGVVEGVEVDYTSIVDANLQEITKYCYRTGHQGSVHIVAINEKKWQTIPEDIQQLMLEIGAKVSAAQIEDRRLEDVACEQKMRDAGVEIFDMTPEDKAIMFEKVQPIYEQYRNEYGLDNLIDQIREIAESAS